MTSHSILFDAALPPRRDFAAVFQSWRQDSSSSLRQRWTNPRVRFQGEGGWGNRFTEKITVLEYYAFRPNHHLSAPPLVERRRKLGIDIDHGPWSDTRTRFFSSRVTTKAWTVYFPRGPSLGDLAQVLALSLGIKALFQRLFHSDPTMLFY
jgi:hypothetical protein